MKKCDDSQLYFDFDNPVSLNDTGMSVAPVVPTANPFVFPKEDTGLNIFETLAVCFGEMQEFLSRYPESLSRFLFKQYFVLGLQTKEIASINKPGLRIPTRERIRQIVEVIGLSLGEGEKCSMLRGIRLNNTVVEELERLKNTECGFYVDTSVLREELACRLPGIAALLSMRIVESSTDLPIQTNRFLLSSDKSIEVFRTYFKLLVQIMQEEVRPQSKPQIISSLVTKLDKEAIDTALVDLILRDSSVFEVVEGEDGQTYCLLLFEHLKVYQQQARIVYEKKSISISDIGKEMLSRGSAPKAQTLTQTSRKFPWCVPMGKTLWIYKEDGQKMESIHDVIKEYCEQHIRFTYDEILEYLHSRQYDMKESSLRNYITRHCRRLNADRNSFCLTSMIPPNEDKLWFKKHIATTRTREVSYHNELIELVINIIQECPKGYIPRKILKKQIASFLEQQQVCINNFYKIIYDSDRLSLVEIEGEVCVRLVD